MNQRLRIYLRQIKYALWALNGYVGLKSHLPIPSKVNVLITYYNPSRMRHINHQLRNLFKCDFVEKVIVSNHNPNIAIDSLVKVRDQRLVIVNQEIRRGCGYRWLVAQAFASEYLVVIDDDILLFPWQLKTLFAELVADPQVPHGFAGMVRHDDDFLEYREKENRSVDYLCEVYAITREHLKRYMELRNYILKNESLARMIEFSVDFVVISQTGNYNPKIHDAGRLFRCPTYNESGIAVHKEREFDKGVLEMARALSDLKKK
ncbi:MAG: glycosyltransferase family 2 protein [candidate division KSB1 bacterium]|nr:glycosyltransferase family 2 protein [candidate division KSB1 bacterium]